MQFIDLKSQYKSIQEKIDNRIKTVLNHGKYIMGPEVKELEEKLANYVGVKHCIGVANGTDALQIALMALDIKPGDAVLTTPFTFFATVEVICLMGAVPVFADIDPNTFNIDPEKVKAKIAQVKSEGKLNLKAIMTVDLFGLPANYVELEKIAKENDLKLIEDSAQGFGGKIGNRMACSFGDIATTSFFPAKPLGCYGDGGAIFTDNDEYAEIIRSIRVHGKGKDKYDNVRIGLNSRLDTIQAAILLEKLAIFDDELVLKQKLADTYSEQLKNSDVKTPFTPENFRSSWAQYTLIAESEEAREAYKSSLSAKSIPTAVYYPAPMHRLTALEAYGFNEGDYPVSEKMSKQVFSLPMHAFMGDQDISEISSTIIGCKVV